MIAEYRFPRHVWDEAESEAWYIIAKAFQSYKPERGYTLAAHVRYRLRMDLKTWAKKSMLNDHDELILDVIDEIRPINEPIDPESERDRDADSEHAALLDAVLEVCDTILTTKDRLCLLGTAIGVAQADISRVTKLNGEGIAAHVTRARKQIKIALKIGHENPLLPSSNKV